MLEKWYGQSGIDTDYERYLIKYRPNLIYPERESNYPLHPDIILQITRSQDFLISRAILDYRSLIERIASLLRVIERRQQNKVFKEYLTYLKKKELMQVFEIENEQSSHHGQLDFEMYTLLYHMMRSLEKQSEFLDDYFRGQVTDETEDEEMLQAERDSINEWIKKEYDITEKYDELHHSLDNQQIEAEIDLLEKERRKLDQLHTSMADVAYVHRNRHVIFSNIVDDAEVLILKPQTQIEGNMQYLVQQLSEMPNKGALQSHLILSFKDYKNKHQSLKQQYMMIDDEKEGFASERNYMYQQIVVETNDDVKAWLYDQPEDSGKSLDLFATYMVEAVDDSKKKYEETLADMLSFYQSEGSFYGRQILLMQKKEEIRQFLRIIEDLEETGKVSDEWIEEYLQIQGYET